MSTLNVENNRGKGIVVITLDVFSLCKVVGKRSSGRRSLVASVSTIGTGCIEGV